LVAYSVREHRRQKAEKAGSTDLIRLDSSLLPGRPGQRILNLRASRTHFDILIVFPFFASLSRQLIESLA
jgi:hypothetical protein